jgi:ubiquinone/menaquinone biosynthesis C-methylase UbiE
MYYTDLQIHLLKQERYIYEIAELYEQNRHDISDKLDILASPNSLGNPLKKVGDKLVCENTNTEYVIKNNVVDFCKNQFEKSEDEWARLNAQFMNYHKSLSVYTLINSVPLLNYLAEKSGLGELKNAKVIDIGAGTGHTLCSFFQNPETLDYYLCDPNLRLLHDQFLRIYPRLAKLKLTHLLCYAEQLPFKSEVADLVMSLSAIDHFKDYKTFFKEGYRVCKKDGLIFVSSHLDVPASKRIQKVSVKSKLFSISFWERVSRYLYYRKYKVGTDDHTNHFDTIEPIEKAMNDAGFKTQSKEEFFGHFWIIGKK